jgi:nucleotide-binding universal stress UspA family protein
MIKKFLVAVDGSDHGWRALELAAGLAKLSDAELIIMHVVPYEAISESLKQFAKAEGIQIEEESARYHAGRTLADTITSDAEASEGVDMLFLGSRGLGVVTSLLLGSVSHKVMNLAPCTCVIVK